ncbi:MAG: sodium:proline symporter [Pseudomonadota bacterium]
MTLSLAVALGIIAVGSFLLAPKVKHAWEFYQGHSPDGQAPGMITLIFSQVTTWIFARSLLTAAILGYYYGIAGGLAYAAYYLSFFTGGAIIASLRFRHGFGSIQDFLRDRFGRTGPWAYNLVIGIRLLSEVFANLLVIGLIFGETGTLAYGLAMGILAAVILVYSMLGGLRASLRTDVFQMSVLAALLAYLLAALLTAEGFAWAPVLSSSPIELQSGWSLLLVALLQVWSYPMHDPVMMDRGFLADRKSTLRSFVHAGWLSIIAIFAFSLLGVYAGLNALQDEALLDALRRLLGEVPMTALSLAFIVSAVSTLDSTFSSAAKLSIVDMGLAQPTLRNGRIAMALFMLGGLAFLFGSSQELFSAVAVSGTASMYLAPVIFFSLWSNARVPTWSYWVSFAAAMAGAALYYTEAGGHTALLEPLTGLSHKYDKLLLISGTVLVAGCGAFAIGLLTRKAAPLRASA